MSIPATAIRRPITMFMICAVIVLIGGISLTRLPVDLLPDISYPSVSVSVGYSGRRAARNGGTGHASASTGVERLREHLDQINSTSAEGRSNVRMSFTWGTDLNEAMNDVRTGSIACEGDCRRTRTRRWS